MTNSIVYLKPSTFWLRATTVGIAVAATSLAFATDQRYLRFEDAAAAQVKAWQSGEKARPLMSSDGKVVFAFGQSMPKLTCSPGRACDIEMEADEKIKKVILADSVNWRWEGAESIERGKTIQHLVFQPIDKELETNVIITTDRRTYHIKLYSPKVEGAYINRAGFYYPQDMVTSWDEKVKAETVMATKAVSGNVMPTPVTPEKLVFDYSIDGDSDFKPIRVFNDSERVYLAMPDSLRTGENPVLILMDEKDKEMVVNYRRVVDPETGSIHYVVDKLFSKAELRRGSEKVKISWKRKEKSFWKMFN